MMHAVKTVDVENIFGSLRYLIFANKSKVNKCM